jgi:hypothetical protein
MKYRSFSHVVAIPSPLAAVTPLGLVMSFPVQADDPTDLGERPLPAQPQRHPPLRGGALSQPQDTAQARAGGTQVSTQTLVTLPGRAQSDQCAPKH